MVRLNVRAVLWPHVLAATTESVPVVKELLKLTVAVVVPWPAVIVALAGAVHTYEVAPATAAMVYVCVATEQTLVLWPLIVDGVPGIL